MMVGGWGENTTSSRWLQKKRDSMNENTTSSGLVPKWAEKAFFDKPSYTPAEIEAARDPLILKPLNPVLNEQVLKRICDVVYTDNSVNSLTEVADAATAPKREIITLKGKKHGRR